VSSEPHADRDTSDADWITVALLGRARGNRGELTAISLSKPERYGHLREVWLFPPASSRIVEAAWFHGQELILKFQGVDSIAEAEALEGCEVRVPSSARWPLEAGEYYESDLLGCEVVERATGASLGRVTAFTEAGAARLLELDNGLLIPFARSICVAIWPHARRILVELPAGLKELNQA
jgi:16S rRNA processing protein RimM